MVAVVSGNGLGLFNSSLTQLGSTSGGQAGIGQSRESQYVNIATGNLLLQGLDENLFRQGLATGLVRTYNSSGTFAQTGTDGWQTSYERTVKLLSGTVNTAGSIVQRATADGGLVNFTWDSTRAAYVSTAGDGAHDTIVLSGTGSTAKWLWTEGSSRQQETYNAGTLTSAGRLEVIANLVTGASDALTYNASNQLTTITGTNGETIDFVYASTTGPLIQVNSHERDAVTGLVTAKTQVTYGYDASGRLISVQTDLTPDAAGDNTWDGTTAANNDGKRFLTTYTYVGTSMQIAKITQSDGVVVSYTYQADGKVKTVTLGDTNINDADGFGQTITYNYNTSTNTTTVADSTGSTWSYQYDANGQLTHVLAPAVNGQSQTTDYLYDGSGNLTRVTQAAYTGAAALLDTVYKYDTNGNLLVQHDRLGNTVERTYNAANQLLTETSYVTPDADGLDPTFTATTNVPSGALTTRYVYDTTNLAQLRFVINAAGEVSENQYNASGSAMGLASMTRRFVGAAYNISALATTAVPTLAQMTTWATTNQAKTARVDFTYDAYGRLSQRTAFASVDANGVGVASDVADEMTSYIYSAHGLLLQQCTLRGVNRDEKQAVSYGYDGMGRRISETVTDQLGVAAATTLRTTTWLYTDSGHSLQVTLENQTDPLNSNNSVVATRLLRTQVYNAAGQTVTVTESAASTTTTRTTQNYYDTAGRLRAAQDATGARSYWFYDADGRIVAQVDATGDVTETRYDGIGRAAQTVSYATRVDTSTWLSGSTVTKTSLVFAATSPTLTAGQAWVQTNASNDRNAYRTYDSVGRLATETDAAGLVTTYAYDGLSRLVSTTVAKPGDATATPRVTRFFYDDASRQVAMLDAAGYLTETVFDAGGRAVKTIRYFTATASANRATGTLAVLRPATNGADQTTRYLYDGRGNQVAMLNAEGYLTEYIYDETANQRAEKAYAKQLTGLIGTEDLSTLRTKALTSPPNPAEPFRLTQRNFNALGQLATELNAEGTLTRYTYDRAGRLIKTEAAQNFASEVRENNRRYDVFGNLIGEMDGQGSLQLVGTLSESQLDALYLQYGTTHNYDLAGRRIETIEAKGLETEGNKTWYFYDAMGRQTFVVRGVANNSGIPNINDVKNSFGEVTETRYSAFGQVTDSLAYTGRITIQTPGVRSSVQTAINTLTFAAATDTRRQFGYDTRGLLTSTTDAEGVVSTNSYTAFGQLDIEQRAIGNSAAVTIDHTYDQRGLETSRIEGVGTAAVRTLSQSYDAFGRVIGTIDGRGTTSSVGGFTTIYGYDRLGRQISHSQVVEGSIEAWQTSYDAYSQVLSQTDALGRVTTYSYVDSTRTVTIKTPELIITTKVHNRFGQTVTVTDGSNATTTFVYDKNGALKQTINPLSQTSSNTYDVHGLLVRTTDATGRNVDYTYDAVGRVLSRIEDPTGLALTTSYSYDGQGRQLTVTDPSHRVSAMIYDREGRLLTQALDPNGLNLRTNYTWDAAGRQLTVVEAAGTAIARTTQYTYDALGRRISEIVDPGSTGKLNLTTLYTYDGDDNVVGRTDGNGNLTRFSYDEANRLRFTLDADGDLSETRYDDDGRVTMTRQYITQVNMTGLAATLTRAQMSTQAASVSNGLDITNFRVYDGDGRLCVTVDGLGDVTANTYDGANRVISSKRYANAITLTTALTTSMQAGTATPAGITVTADPTDQVVTFAYDAAGRMLRQTDGVGAVTRFVYDAAGRTVYTINPLGGFTRNWYDQAGRLTATRQFSSPFNIATLSDSTTTAQLDGLLVWGATDQGRYFVYDESGKVRYTLAVGGTLTESTYDSAGRQVSSRIYATTASINSAMNTQLFAGTAYGALVPPAVNNAADRVSYSVYNELSQVRMTVDGAGNVAATAYDAAGRAIIEKRYAAAADISTLRAGLAAGTTTITQLTNKTPVNTAIDMMVYHVYDATGRMRYSVNSLGQTTETRYDAAGRAIGTCAYAVAINLATQSTLVAAMNAGTAIPASVTNALTSTADAARDNQTYVVLDGAGQQRHVIDALGDVTEMRYDAAGRVTQRLAYTLPIPSATFTTANIAALAAGTITTTAATGWITAGMTSSAQVSTQVFDAAGRLRYTMTKDSATTVVVTEHRYDSVGRVVADIVYATPIANNLPPTAATGNQRLTRYVYDANGRLHYTIDDAGAVSEKVYDGLGQIIEERTYQILIPANTPATEAGVQAALTAWSTDLSSTTVPGLNMASVGQYGNSLIQTGGQLVFRPGYSTSPPVYPSVYRTQSHSPSENVTFSAELTTSSSLSSTYFLFGLENTLTGADYRRAGFYISNGTLLKNENVGGPNTNTTMGTLAVNTTYVIEAHSGEDGVDYYVYVKGTDKSTGFRFTVAETDHWDNIRLKLLSSTTGNPDGNPLYVDNLSESAPCRSTVTRYNSSGQVVAVTDNLGNTESYTYNALGQQITRTDKLGNVWTKGYDAAGRVTTETSPAVSVSTVDDNGVVSTSPTPRAIVTQIAYDALGNVLSRTEDAGQSTARQTTYTYDAVGHQITTTFPRAWQYNSSTNAFENSLLPSTITVTYDALGHAVVQNDVRGKNSYKIYDVAGRLVYEVDAENYLTAYGYDAQGEQISLTRYSTKLNTTTALFSGWSPGKAMTQAQVASGIIAGNDRVITSTYDARGNKISVVLPSVTYYKNDGTSASGSPTTNLTYDAYGQLIKDSVLLEGTTWADTYHYYDDLGRETLTVDPEGYVTQTVYDALGQVVQTTEFARAINTSGLSTVTVPGTPAAGDACIGYDRVVRYTYDALGRKATETTASHYQLADGTAAVRDVTTLLGYDAEGHATRLNIDGMDTVTTYDALGRALTVQEAERDVLRSDAEARIAASSTLDLTSASLYERASPYSTLMYDAFGNQVQVTRYANGMRNGVVTVDAARDQVSVSRYDRQGRKVLEVDAEGNKTYKKYDAADHAIEIWSRLDNNDGRYAIVRTTATYDNVGRQTSTTIKRETYQNYYTQFLTQGTITDSIEQVTYNAFGEMVNKWFDGSATPPIANSFVFNYNAVGRLTGSNAEGGVTRNYGYNLAGAQLYEAHQTRISSGVITAITLRQADKLGHVTRVTLPSYTLNTTVNPVVTQRYDRWGNTLEVVDARGFQTTMEYNASNQVTRTLQPLVNVVYADGTSSWLRPEVRTFYDALGRIIAEKDANGNIEATVYDAVGRAIRTVDALGNSARAAFDVLGNQRLSQDPVGHITYEKFNRLGQVTSQGDFLPALSGLTRDQKEIERYTLNQHGDRLSVTQRVTDTVNATQKYDYDSRQLLLRSQSATGIITEYRYDSQGRKIREINALSDGSYAAYLMPVYGGGLVLDNIQQQNVSFTYTIPSTAFTAPSGEVLTISVDIQRFTGSPDYTYNSVTDSGLTFDPSTNKVTGIPTITGNYRMIIKATSTSGESVSKTISLSVLDATSYSAAMTGKPRVTAGLMDQTVVPGTYWQFTVPPGTFTDPTNQSLTYSAKLGEWVDANYEYDAETHSYLLVRPAHWEYRALTSSDWVQFDAVNKKFTGTPNDVGGWQLMVTAVDPDGNSASTTVALTSTAPASGTASIHDTSSDGNGGTEDEYVKQNEQTWDYDAFGRMTDHNDLSGIDYDYTIDGQTGQTTVQSSDWTETTVIQAASSLSGLFQQIINGIVPGTYTNSAARSMKFYANGQLQELTEGTGTGSRTYRYQYDAAGNRILEESETQDPNGAVVKLRTKMTYDSHNRLEHIIQEDYTSSTTKQILDLIYSYDANGNRRRIQAQGALSSTAPAISNPNHAPTTTGVSIANQTIRQATPGSFRVRSTDIFRDVDLNPLLISAAGLPTGLTLTIDPANGDMIFTYDGKVTNPLGTFTIAVTAKDSTNQTLSASTSFTVTLVDNSGPALITTAVPAFNSELNAPFSLDLAARDYFVDPDLGDTLQLSVVSGPSWLQLVGPTNSPSLHFAGTPTTAGSYTITLQAKDQGGKTINKSFTVVVASNFAPTPLSQTVPPFIIGRVNSWDQLLSNVFTDSDGNLASVSATQADGSALPSWLSLETVNLADGPHLLLAGQPPDGTADGTTYSVKLTATDALGLSSSTTFTLTAKRNLAPNLINGVPTQTPRVNQLTPYTQSFNAASLFNDPENDLIDYSLTFDANDPTAQWLALSFDRTTGTLTFSGTPWNNTQAGTHVVHLVARDPDGATATMDITYQIAGNNPPVYSTGLNDTTLIAGHNLRFGIPGNAFTDADGDALTYSATQLVYVPGYYDGEGYWEPGRNEQDALPSWLSFDGQYFTGTAPASSAPITIRLQAKDPLNRTAVRTFVLTVASSGSNAAPVYTAGSLVNRNAVAGQPVNYALPPNAFTDASWDALTYSMQVLVGSTWVAGSTIGLGINASTGQITGTLTNAAQSSYSVKITASDGVTTANGTFVLNVANGAPTVPNPAPNQFLTTGQSFTYLLPAFVDPNNDPLTYTATGLPAGVTLGSSSHQFAGTPAAGTYTITVTATDGHGGSVSDTFVLTVGTNTNVAPTVNQTTLSGFYQSTITGDYLDFNISSAFSDPNGDPLTYTQVGKPAWLAFDGTTGRFTGTAGAITKSFTITITADDGRGGTVSGSFTIDNTSDTGGGTGTQQVQMFAMDSGATTMALMNATEPQDPIGGFGDHSFDLGQDVWYTYDAENRVVIANGKMLDTDGLNQGAAGSVLLSDTAISASYTYDAAGNQVTRMLYIGGVAQVERRGYDLRGQLIYTFQPVRVGSTTDLAQVNTYDGVGRLVKQIEYYGAGTMRAVYGGGSMDVRGWIKHSETYVYDLDGRVTSQVTSGRVLGWTAVGGHTASDEDELYNLTTLSTVTTYYDGLSRSSGYKWNYLRHDENYTGPASDPVGYTHTYAITYEARDSYLEKSIYGYSTNSYYKASTSTMQYDAWGRMVGVRENTPNQTIDDRLRYFAYDGEGGVLRRREGTVDSHNVFTQTADQINKDSVFAYANGQQLAEQSRDGTKLDVYGQFGNTETVPEHLSKKQQKAANKSAALGNHTGAYDTYTQRYTAYDANSMGSQRVVVQQGESLQSIAQRVYGNASLWYVLASANALSTNSDLIAGTQLKVPDVGISKNTSSTFKPYNPSEIIGNTSPNLPYMPPPPGMSCGQTFALIIATVIRVVTQWIGHVLVATGYLAWLAPIVGAAGEFVAQTVEKDAGLRDEYNWGAVAVAAVTVFIVGSEESTIGQDIGRAMLTAAASYVGSYLVNRALGHEDHFSLKAMLGQVAVAGVTTGLGDEMSGVKNGVDPTGGMVSKTAGSIQINWSQVASYVVKQTVQNVVTNVVGGLVYSAVTGEAYKFDPRAVLADAFGNALGSAATTIMDAEWKNHLENKEKMKNLTQSQRKEYDFWRSKGQGQGLALYNALDEGGLQKRMAGLLFQSHDDADTEQGGEGGVETSPQVTTISVQMDAAESPDSDQSNFIGGDPNHPNDPRRWIVAPDFAEPEYYPVAGSTDANAGSSDASAGTSTVAAACSATSTDAGNANTAAAASSSSDHIGEGFDTVFANDPEGIHREFFGDDQSPDVAQTLISTTRRKHPHSATYGPLFSGSESLADYPGWNELINCGTVTKSEQNIMVAVSPNEGKLDTIQAWDSEVLTAGAMQKTIRVEGGGEFPQQVYEFGQEHPDLYKKLFVDHGWEVSDVNGTKTMSYKGVTGSALKTELRVGFDQTAWANKTKVFSEPLSSIVDAISTDEFKAKQVTDFVARLRTAISIKPTKGQDLTIGDYLQSDLGRALVLDEHINRPNDVKGDFSAALKGFFHANPLAPSDPANWGANRAIYEQQLIQIYGPNRSMTQGYKRYMNLVRRL